MQRPGPAASISVRAPATTSGRRAQIATSAPSAARAKPQALPIPSDAPVISATRPRSPRSIVPPRPMPARGDVAPADASIRPVCGVSVHCAQMPQLPSPTVAGAARPSARAAPESVAGRGLRPRDGRGVAAPVTRRPQIDGALRAPGLRAPVEIIRDAAAVPHIYAQCEADALFGLGFVHAQDRYWQMEFYRRAAQGRMAEVAGPDGAALGPPDALRGPAARRRRRLGCAAGGVAGAGGALRAGCERRHGARSAPARGAHPELPAGALAGARLGPLGASCWPSCCPRPGRCRSSAPA